MLPLSAPEAALVPLRPVASRTLRVFGASAELVWLPERALRHGRPGAARPAFAPSPVPRILGEAFWSDAAFALTPNRFPFARAQRLLWPRAPQREPDAAFWQLVAEWVVRAAGTGMVNQVGAAASIARAHAHLTPEQLPFLAELPEVAAPADLLALPAGVSLVAKAVPFCLLGVRGAPAPRAAALLALAELRLTAVWTAVVVGDTTWLYPRSREVPAPHFPQALGAAELWGRWCYVEETPFAAATAEDLEAALLAAGMPAL